MVNIKFPKDCQKNCPHFHTWDMSVDDWTCVCDLLKMQIDDCDMDFKWAYCPLKDVERIMDEKSRAFIFGERLKDAPEIPQMTKEQMEECINETEEYIPKDS